MRTLVLLLMFTTTTVWSQSPADRVYEFFEAFHQRDSVALGAFFTKKAQLQTLVEVEGKPSRVAQVDINRFVQAVSNRPDTPVWEERLGNPTVLQHQGLAQVWVPYRFLLDGKTTHCGYNSFQWVLLDGQWQINQLIDTRTKTCEDSAFPAE
ncbi:MAG: nuclear transport factor 2 family protein [Flavobacteriaceae bacterium]